MAGYVEEAVKKGFTSPVKDGDVTMILINFQAAKNEEFTKAYASEGHTLIRLDVKCGKVVSWKPVSEVWNLAGKRDKCFNYVRGEVQS